MSPVNVGERIRQLRLGFGMSMRALAAQTGFSPSLISQVEKGHVTPSIGSLERIAMALGVSLGQFFAEPKRSPVVRVRARARPQLTSTWSPVSIEALGPLDGSDAGAHHALHGAWGTQRALSCYAWGRAVCSRCGRGGPASPGGQGAYPPDR